MSDDTDSSPVVVLYSLKKAWGLPSLSVACVQVEAYLRLSGVPFVIQQCSAPSASPTGQVPAVDTSTDLVAAEVSSAAAAPLAEFAAARIVIDYLKAKVVDLDRGLTASQRAEAAAYGALVEAKLIPAILYSTWCEAEAFSQHTRGAYGGDMPFPLSYFIPRAQRKALLQQFASTSSSQMYKGAGEALDALAMRLFNGGSDFFFGSQPSSLDALLFSCLAYIRAAPVVHPELRRKLEGHRVLGNYVDRLSDLAFATRVPAAEDVELRWSGSEGTQAADDRYSKAKSEKESELQRKGRRWLICAGAAIAAYVFFSGQYLQFDLLGYDMEGEDADEE